MEPAERWALLLEARREALKALSINSVTGMTLDMLAEVAIVAVTKIYPELLEKQVEDPLFQHSADPKLHPRIMTEQFNPDEYSVIRSDTLELDSPLELFEETRFWAVEQLVRGLVRFGKAIRHTVRGHLYLHRTELAGYKPTFCFIVMAIAKKGKS